MCVRLSIGGRENLAVGWVREAGGYLYRSRQQHAAGARFSRAFERIAE
jgi:hypothetical protein